MKGRAIVDENGRIVRAGTRTDEGDAWVSGGVPLPDWALPRDLPRLRWTGTEWAKETEQ